MNAKGTTLALFTATPIVDNPVDDSRAIMSIVVGKKLGSTDPIPEGYVSWFMDRPRNQFASTSPVDIDTMPPPIFVPLRGRVLERYLIERFGMRKPRKRQSRREGDSENEDGVEEWMKKGPQRTKQHGCITNQDDSKLCKNTIAQYEHLAFYVRNPPIDDTGNKGDSVQRWGREGFEYTSKAAAIALSVRDNPVKTCIIMHLENGYNVLQRLLEYHKVSYVEGEAMMDAMASHLVP